MILNLCAIFIGGGLGSLLRFGAALLSKKLFASTLLGTLFVNLLGSFLIGLIFGLILSRAIENSNLKAFLTVGLLGGLTTFSTLNIEAFDLIRMGRTLQAGAYLTISIIFGLTATFLGYLLSTKI